MQALRILCIAVVACDGAYMGVTTNVPQQLALGTPLSRRAAPAVAVISTKRPKVIYSSFPSCSALAAWSRACTHVVQLAPPYPALPAPLHRAPEVQAAPHLQT